MASGFYLGVAENLRYKNSTYIHDLAALFEPNWLMREANKPSLADDANWNSAKATEMLVPSNREERNHICDGGALIKGYFCLKMPHLIPYVTCILNSVFDGEGPSMKDTANLRPSGCRSEI